MAPTVSVIIPNFNHAPYLRQRIDSVLAQTFTDFEVILLDDCSTDSSRSIIESYRQYPQVRHIVFNEQNSGSTFAQWKRGLALAKGEFVWIAESDDYADPEFLATLVGELNSHPEAVMAFSGSHMVDAGGKAIPGMDWDRWKKGTKETECITGRELAIRKLLWTSDVYNASMVLFRRAVAPPIEDVQLTMRYCGDWFFWANMAQKGGAVEVRKKLNYFRQHNAKVSPGASKSGLYFIEGLPVMLKIADFLQLGRTARKMLAGRTLKRLAKFPDVVKTHGTEILANINRLSPGSTNHRRSRIALYELDKYLNFTHLQP